MIHYPTTQSAPGHTIRGGIPFRQLCKGKEYYSFNLTDLSSERKMKTIRRKLRKQFDSTVLRLEQHSRRKIRQLYIGTTYIDKKVFKLKLNPLMHSTWKKEGIGSRWTKHQKKGNGMVVLGAVTKETLIRYPHLELNQFALAIEQELIHHYKIHRKDSRFTNKFNSGRTPSKNRDGYVIYMTFRYAATTQFIARGSSQLKKIGDRKKMNIKQERKRVLVSPCKCSPPLHPPLQKQLLPNFIAPSSVKPTSNISCLNTAAASQKSNQDSDNKPIRFDWKDYKIPKINPATPK